MNNSLVTIIIPIYNVERYLTKCIDSVISQTYTNLEILLVDDGSTDNCPIICDEYEKLDSRIKVFHKKNGGLSDARNYGLDNMSGDFVYFLDSDDYISADAIECLVASQEMNNSDIVIGNSVIIDENNNQTEWSCTFNDEVFLAKELLERKIIPAKYVVAWNKLYSASVFNTVRFPKSLIHEDEYILSDIVRNSKIISTVSKVTYYYFQRSNGIMKSKSIKRGDLLFALSHRIDYYIENNDNVLLDNIIFKAYDCYREIVQIAKKNQLRYENIKNYHNCFIEILEKCDVSNLIISLLKNKCLFYVKNDIMDKFFNFFIYHLYFKKKR